MLSQIIKLPCVLEHGEGYPWDIYLRGLRVERGMESAEKEAVPYRKSNYSQNKNEDNG